MAAGLATLHIRDCPSKATAGDRVSVTITVSNESYQPLEIMASVLWDGLTSGKRKRFIDETDLFQSKFGANTMQYTGTFTMPNEDVELLFSTAYKVPDDLHDYFHPDAAESRRIALEEEPEEEYPPEEEPTDRYWVTLAEGRTVDELKAACAGLSLTDSFRYVIETERVPKALLGAAGWLANQLSGPLNKIGVDLKEVVVKSRRVYIYMHGSPVAATTVVILLGLAACFTSLGIWYYKLLIQKEVTKEAFYRLEKAKTDYEIAIIIDDWPEDQRDAYIHYVAETGEKGLEKEGVDWESLIKWGIVGTGVIAGTIVVLPRVLDLISRRK